jgi:hypothetical protein
MKPHLLYLALFALRLDLLAIQPLPTAPMPDALQLTNDSLIYISTTVTNLATNTFYDARFRTLNRNGAAYVKQYSLFYPLGLDTFRVVRAEYGGQNQWQGSTLCGTNSEQCLLHVVCEEPTSHFQYGYTFTPDMQVVSNFTVLSYELLSFTNPATLGNQALTNLATITNAASAVQIYSSKPDCSTDTNSCSVWMTNTPAFSRNPHCVLFNLLGATALSPWNSVGRSGQVPFTLLTRRHAYTRGHGTGLEAGQRVVLTNFTGAKVFFVDRSNNVVTMVVTNDIGSLMAPAGDYHIVQFTQDVPANIEVMAQVSAADYSAYADNGRRPLSYTVPDFETEQGGNCFIKGVPAFDGNAYKGGDSGSPNMLAIPNGNGTTTLVMHSGRSTAAASSAMQEDIDKLSLSIGLNTNAYRITWYDLSRFPRLP